MPFFLSSRPATRSVDHDVTLRLSCDVATEVGIAVDSVSCRCRVKGYGVAVQLGGVHFASPGKQCLLPVRS